MIQIVIQVLVFDHSITSDKVTRGMGRAGGFLIHKFSFGGAKIRGIKKLTDKGKNMHSP